MVGDYFKVSEAQVFVTCTKHATELITWLQSKTQVLAMLRDIQKGINLANPSASHHIYHSSTTLLPHVLSILPGKLPAFLLCCPVTLSAALEIRINMYILGLYLWQWLGVVPLPGNMLSFFHFLQGNFFINLPTIF